MDKRYNSVLQLNDYKIEFIEYAYNSSFVYENPINVSVKSKVDVGTNVEEQKSKVSIDFSVFPDEEKTNPFKLRILMTGYFSSSGSLSKQELSHLSRINGTAVLFPFLRSAIVNITSQANIQPLLLPLIDVNKFLEVEEG